ncbi:MAG: hypothetical protein AABZ06_10985 [Bdellovibrionota bacterium]
MMRIILLTFLCSVIVFCGQITLGPPVAFNDPEPQGTIIAQGSFVGLNGRTVSGTSTIYLTDIDVYTIRLAGFSIPAESGIQMIAVVNDSSLTPVTLSTSGGNKNYSITLSGSVTWKQIRIHSAPNNLDYGQALLTKAP